MQSIRAYKFRLRPSPEHEQQFLFLAGCRRFVWNWALATFGEGFHYHTAALALTQFKQTEKCGFLKEAVAQSLQQVLRDLQKAFQNKKEGRARWPRWKSKHTERPAFGFPQAVRLEGDSVVLPRIGKVELVLHRPVTAEIKSATIKQTPTGKWNITLICHEETTESPLTYDNPVGLDVGLESFVTLSTGQKVIPPRVYRKQQAKLRRTQRRVSRKQKRSKNRAKARKVLARVHEKIHHQRQDFLHQLTHRLVKCHDVLCIEDLNLAALTKTKLRGHAKSWLDAAHGEFRRQLQYKARWHCKRIIVVDRFFPSSQICSVCGRQQKQDLCVREFICAGCSTHHDRDINAAVNVLAEGLSLLSTGTVAVMPVEEPVRPEFQASSSEAGKVLDSVQKPSAFRRR